MRVGIYLGDFSPDVGGGYTFQDEVFRAFSKVAVNSAHQFVVMGTSEHLGQYVQSVTQGIACKIVIIKSGIIERYVETVKNYSPLWRKFLPIGPIERAAHEAGLDILWYVGGGGHEATDIPYVATVWDLQHRLTPWFPEMSANGTWDAREAAYKRFLQRATYIITGTQVGRTELNLCYEVDQSRVKILPHPTPTFTTNKSHASDIRSKLNLTEAYLFYPAQFWPHKNHINLLHSLAILRDVHKVKMPLVFAGSEKGNVHYIKNTVIDLNLTDQVCFAGFVSQEELVDLYTGASMLVYPSYCGPENLPPLEAFSLGCPVLAAHVPGSEEQLGKAARFFNPSNPLDIASNIMELKEDLELRNQLRVLGHLRAKSWTSEDFAKDVLLIFEEFSAIRRSWPSQVSI